MVFILVSESSPRVYYVIDDVVLFPVKLDIVTVHSGMFFTQWAAGCVHISLLCSLRVPEKPPFGARLFLLTLSFWMRRNTGRKSCESGAHCFSWKCALELFLCSQGSLVVIEADVKRVQKFPSFCSKQHFTPKRGCYARLSDTNSSLSLYHTHTLCTQHHIQRSYIEVSHIWSVPISSSSSLLYRLIYIYIYIHYVQTSYLASSEAVSTRKHAVGRDWEAMTFL